MKLSTKGRYAIIALIDLVNHGSNELVTLVEISKRQKISLAYLEQLFVKLRRAEIVVSVRGPGGGYKIARNSELIRISEAGIIIPSNNPKDMVKAIERLQDDNYRNLLGDGEKKIIQEELDVAKKLRYWVEN